MRRKEKEIRNTSDIEAVIRKAQVCRIGIVAGDKPYLVPMCFGYRDKAIYLHSAAKGMKIDALRKDPNICFEFDINTRVVEAEKACDWGMTFQSVIGYGKAVFLEEMEEKEAALKIIMAQYSDRDFNFPESAVKGTAVIKIEIERMTGKQSDL